MEFLTMAAEEGSSLVPSIANAVTTDMLKGVLDQITGLLPVVLPIAVGAIAFRKGLGFLFKSLRGL